MLDIIHVNEKKKSQQRNSEKINERSISDRKNHNENIQNDLEKNVQHRSQLNAHAFTFEQTHQCVRNEIDNEFDIRHDYTRSLHQKIEKRQFTEKTNE